MNYWKRVRKVLRKSNMVLEVIDARFAREMRDKKFEQNCIKADKKLIIVINKIDLISKTHALKLKKEFSKKYGVILVSCKKRKGKLELKKIIQIFSKKRKVLIGVMGFPNTGKSSLINYLKGKKTAKTSIVAGFTRGEQLFKLSKNVYLIDTPGVLPYFKGGEAKLALMASKNPQAIKDPIFSAQKILAQIQHNGIKEVFGVKISGNDFEGMLEKMAVKKKRLKKGGIPDIEIISKKLILDWQKGKIMV